MEKETGKKLYSNNRNQILYKLNKEARLKSLAFLLAFARSEQVDKSTCSERLLCKRGERAPLALAVNALISSAQLRTACADI